MASAMRRDCEPTLQTLSSLAVDIAHGHEAALQAYGRTVEHCRRTGELLIKAKALVPHGEWLQWIEDHCAFSARAAQVYMRLAKANPQRVADLPLREAIKRIAEAPAKTEAEVTALPAPGSMLISHLADEGEIAVIVPAVEPDSFFVACIKRRSAEVDEWEVVGSKKRITGRGVDVFLRHMGLLDLSWEPGPATPWQYNEFLFDSLDQSNRAWLGLDAGAA